MDRSSCLEGTLLNKELQALSRAGAAGKKFKSHGRARRRRARLANRLRLVRSLVAARALLVRRELKKRPTIRLVIMSATVQCDLFRAYFAPLLWDGADTVPEVPPGRVGCMGRAWVVPGDV